MKTSLLHFFGLLLILSFSASCGKKEGGGGSGSGTSFSAIETGLTGTSLQNATALKAWYADTTSVGSFPNVTNPVIQTFRMEKSSRTWSESCKKLLIFNFCSQNPTATVLSEVPVSGVLSTVNKANFPRLAEVMNNSLGQIINIQTKQGMYGYATGALAYSLDILRADGKYISVIIDTSIHPAFNPISSYNYETKVEEYVSKIRL